MARAAANLCPPNGMHFTAPDAEIEAGRDIGCNNTIEVNHFNGIASVSRSGSPPTVGVTEVIAWLTDYSVNYFPAHEKVCTQRALDTGRWFSKMLVYKLWVVLGFGKYRNLECVGIPGAGKTTMVSMVIEDLQDRVLVKRGLDIVLYAYFRHDTQATQTIPIVLAGLIVQVIKQTGKVSSDIRKLYQDYHDSSNSDMAPAVNRMVKILQCELSKFLRVYIVVDALDEYSLPNYSPSHALVVQLQRLNARHLITSRYAVGFAPKTFSTLKVAAHIDDIRIVLQSHLTGHLATIVYDTPGLLEEILGAIVIKSAGMFIVAKLLIICISNSCLLTANDLRAAVKELPSGIEDTYHLAMTRIQGQEPHLAELGTQALYWVYFSKRRLTVMELRHALSFQRSKIISKDDLIGEDRIHSACAGLISFVKLKDKRKAVECQFSHFTTREFLDKFWQKYFLDAECHITETCVGYLANAVVEVVPPDVAEAARRELEGTVWPENVKQYCDRHGLALCAYAVEHLAPNVNIVPTLHDMHVSVRNHLLHYFATVIDRTPGLLEETVRAVIMKSAGIFEVATLLMNFIPKTQAITADELRGIVKDLPSGVQGTYEMAINWIQDQEPYLARLGIGALAWVHLSKRQLTVTELRHALSFQHFKVISGADLIGEDQILTACAGLIAFEMKVEDGEETVKCQFSHITAKEFLDKFWQKYLPDGERQVTETCLGYLTVAMSGVSPDVTETARRFEWEKHCQDHDFALYAYAVEYWSDHARAMDEAFDLDVRAGFFKHPVSPYTANNLATQISPEFMAPEEYWILYFARLGLLKLFQKYTGAIQSNLRSREVPVNYHAIQDRPGRTALHLSALGGHSKVVEFLLNSGANVNSLSFDQKSPLHFAVQAGSSGVATVQLFLDRGAIVDQPDKWQRAPIHDAIKSSWTHNAPSPDIIRLLLQHDVNIYRVSRSDFQTPLSLARRNKNLKIKQLLEDYARTHLPP